MRIKRRSKKHILDFEDCHSLPKEMVQKYKEK